MTETTEKVIFVIIQDGNPILYSPNIEDARKKMEEISISIRDKLSKTYNKVYADNIISTDTIEIYGHYSNWLIWYSYVSHRLSIIVVPNLMNNYRC